MHRRALLSTLGAAAVGVPLAGSRVAADGDLPTLEPLAELPVQRAADVNVDAAGETAYVTTRTGFLVVDVSDPTAPEVLAEHDELLADHEDGPLDLVRDATVDGDRLLVTAHVLGSPEDGGAVVLYDVGDPANPQRVAVRDTPYMVHNGDVLGDVAAVTATRTDRWPMVLLDASDGLAELGRWSVLDAVPTWEQVDSRVRRLHDVFLRDDTAYCAYWDAGAWLVDVSDPADPTPVRQIGGRNPEVVAGSDAPAMAEQAELPGNATAVRPNGDGSLVGFSREGTGSTTGHVGRFAPGGLDVWHADGERAVTIAPPDVRDAGTAWAKNFGWRGDRLYVAFREAGIGVFDLSTPEEPLALGSFANPDEDDVHTARPIASGFVGLTIQGGPDADPTTHLFTFPEPSGDDAEPAPTRAVGTATPTATVADSPTPTDTRTAAGTPTAAPPDSVTGTPQPDRTTAPGVGALGAFAAWALAAWRLRHRD